MKTCDHVLKYDKHFDSTYCEECDVWISGLCEDPHCEFCRKRPVKPSIIYGEKNARQSDEDVQRTKNAIDERSIKNSR